MLLSHAWANVSVWVGVFLDYPEGWRKRERVESREHPGRGPRLLCTFLSIGTQVIENSSLSKEHLTHFVCSKISSHLRAVSDGQPDAACISISSYETQFTAKHFFCLLHVIYPCLCPALLRQCCLLWMSVGNSCGAIRHGVDSGLWELKSTKGTHRGVIKLHLYKYCCPTTCFQNKHISFSIKCISVVLFWHCSLVNKN